MLSTRHTEKYIHLGLASRAMTLVTSAIIGLLIGWWVTDREPCYKMVGGRAVPNPAGQNVELDLQLEIEVNTQGCRGDFIREITSSTGWTWTSVRTPISFSVLSPGRHKTHSQVPFRLPRGIDDGRTTVRSHVWFTRPGNPLTYLWPIHYTSPDLHFMIKSEK